MEILGVVLFVWILPVILSAVVGSSKGKTGVGFILGFFLSWLGFIITLVLSPSAEIAYAKQKELDNKVNPDEKMCPYCAEIIKKEAKICRYCGKSLELA